MQKSIVPMGRLLVALWCLLFIGFSQAEPSPLRPTEAFIPTITEVSANNIRIELAIAEHYYIYRERLLTVVLADESANQGVSLAAPILSIGETKTDPYFGDQSIWYASRLPAIIDVPYENLRGQQQITIELTLQGCLDKVICYPPETYTLPISLPTDNQVVSTVSMDDSLENLKAPTETGLFKSSTGIGSSSSNLFNNSQVGVASQPQLLSEDKAFRLYVSQIDETTLSINWTVAPDYYLYKDKINITEAANQVSQISLAPGELHSDVFFGEQEVYRGAEAAEARVYLKSTAKDLALTISYQGCADVGVCYPVMTRQITLDAGGSTKSADKLASSITTAESARLNPVDEITAVLTGNIWLSLGLLLIAGMALSFTPCVLPMVPILLGIITSQRQISKQRAALLSSSYVLGMAVLMAVIGLLIAKTGINLQILLQKPIWLVAFSAIFVVMGLAMFGCLNIAMPSVVQNKVIHWQNQLQDAKPINLFLVGALSILIVGPCVAPPLIAILAFISTTNNASLGGVYLFTLGLGMGLPLILFSTVFSTVPRTGGVSKLINKIFGMLMFGVALWMLSRLLSGSINLLLWGVYCLAYVWILSRASFVRPAMVWSARVIAGLFLLTGLSWIVGGIMGHDNLFRPFAQTVRPHFSYVNTLDELQQAIDDSDKIVVLDLYADWCVSCQEVEYVTFADQTVASALNKQTLLKLDITDTNAEHRKILKKYGLVGPPGLLFFKAGQEQKSFRIVGVASKADVLETLQTLDKPAD